MLTRSSALIVVVGVSDIFHGSYVLAHVCSALFVSERFLLSTFLDDELAIFAVATWTAVVVSH